MSSNQVHGTAAYHDLVAAMLARPIADYVVTL